MIALLLVDGAVVEVTPTVTSGEARTGDDTDDEDGDDDDDGEDDNSRAAITSASPLYASMRSGWRHHRVSSLTALPAWTASGDGDVGAAVVTTTAAAAAVVKDDDE